jgi:hypothetical protein
MAMAPAKPKRDLSRVQITGHPVDIGRGPGGGPLEGGLRLTRELPFDVDDPEMPYLMTLVVRAQEGKLVCGEATIRQRLDGPPVTGAVLRSVVVDSYLRLIRQGLSEPARFGGMVLIREVATTSESRIYEPPSQEDLVALSRTEHRRTSLDEMLPRVANAYREALADPVDAFAPTLSVARRLYVSRGHAARLVSQARKAGLLGPARRGIAGEVLRETTETEESR